MRLTAERLRELLAYDPATGIFVWKRRADVPARWNSRYAGTIAGTISRGYVRISIDDRSHQAHRLAWLWSYGRWPAGELDHKNCVGDDNRLSNLRPASRSQNIANSRSRSAGGLKGTYFNKKRGRWQARISVNGRDFHLGCFGAPDAAHAAYAAAAIRHFGEFARAE